MPAVWMPCSVRTFSVKMGLLQNSFLKIMNKTRNLFSAKTAQKGFRVFDVMLFPPYPFHPLAEGSSISAAE